jgi:hypothetical protein
MTTSDVTRDLSRLSACGRLLALKTYRVHADTDPALPVIPCLDHEAMLHQRVPPHAAAYLHCHSHDIHEVILYPARRRLEVDTMSTLGEFSDESHAQLLESLRRGFPEYRISVKEPSWWRGDRRVATACRAQVTLRDVLVGEDLDHLKRQLDRLQMVGALMEKHSRVTSWAVRTSTGPILAAVGVVLYAALGLVAPRVGLTRITELQYLIVGTLSATFLYYGLKAVQLTDMSTRVWKRASEYALILIERKRRPPPRTV